MHKCFVRALFVVCLAAAVLPAHGAFAQAGADDKPVMLVTWFGPGAITLPSGAGMEDGQ